MDGSRVWRDSEPCSKRRKLRDYPVIDSNDSENCIINPSVVNQLPLLAGHGVGQEEYSNPFDSLSNEVIQEICLMLSLRDKMSFQLVNRRLYSICSDPYLWRNVSIDDAHEMNAPFIKSALKTCRPHVQSLSLMGQAPFSGYQQMIVSCQDIHTLNLYGFDISLDALKTILLDLPHLQSLTLSIIRCGLDNIVEYFYIFSDLRKVAMAYDSPEADGPVLFERWLLNYCLPQTFIIISLEGKKEAKEYWSRNRQHLPSITHSAYFASYTRHNRPLNFFFYDVPEYSLEIGPSSSESVAVTANGKLMVTMKDVITPTNDVSQRYAVFKDEAVTPGLSVYTSQYGVNITILDFFSVTISLESFRMIVKETPNVLEVSLRDSTISDCLDAYMAPLSVFCLKLRGLDVSLFSPGSRDSIKFDVEHFWNLLSRMKHLKYLFVNCWYLSPLTSNSQDGKRPSRVLTDRELAVKKSVMNHIRKMSSLKSLHVVNFCNVTEELDYFICKHLFLIISNLESLFYLTITILYTADATFTLVRKNLATYKLIPIEGLESILQKCQKLSALVINCLATKGIKLPEDPALYANLTHFWLRCKYTKITLAFGNALVINSKKQLKHLVLSRVTKKDVLDKIKEGNFLNFYQRISLESYYRHDRNASYPVSKADFYAAVLQHFILRFI